MGYFAGPHEGAIWYALEDGNVDGLAQALHAAQSARGRDAVVAFLNKPSQPCGLRPSGEGLLCPLHEVVAKNYENGGACELARILVDAGSGVDVVDSAGRTPLHIAALLGKLALVHMLLGAGASTSVAEKTQGYFALDCAAMNGHAEVARLIAAKHGNINTRSRDKRTALHIACLNGHTEVVKVLLAQACALHLVDNMGLTALHYAAAKGHGDIARALLEAGELVNAREISGSTPLHFASTKGHTGMVALLKANGAYLAARNNEGRTAYEVANMDSPVVHERLRSLLFDPALAGGSSRRPSGPAAGVTSHAPPQHRQQPTPQPSHNVRRVVVNEAAAGRHSGGGGRGGGRGLWSPSSAVSPELVAWLRSNDLAELVLPLCAQLGLASLSDVVHVREEDLSAIPVVQRRKFVAAAAAMARPPPGGGSARPGGGGAAGVQGYVPMPFPAVDNAKSFDAHAEAIAVAYMRRALGYADAKTNGGIHTPDGGVDVVSSRAVAQVKANFRSGAVKRGPIMQLVGDTTPPSPFAGRKLLFFAVSFTDDAVRAAKERGIRLFTMDSQGVVTTV